MSSEAVAKNSPYGNWINNPENLNRLAQKTLKNLGLPAIGLLIFLGLWHVMAANVETSLGNFPGPVDVWNASITLQEEHVAERAKEVAFYERQEVRNADRVAADPSYEPRIIPYTGKATFVDQIITSLKTVGFGFIIASIIAIPLGIICGLSDSVYRAVNPIIQLFKPVSPLAWLPLVTMVVSALYVSDEPMFDKSFLNSAFTVALCCLWPTVINTTVGVSNIDRDLINVGRVIQLPTIEHIRRIVLPSSIPMIFTGLRLSLATGWMVLIAAEMLAQNPGLGKFIWDEFQNGSSNSLSRIMTAVIAIGLIGFILDRGMLSIQKYVSWDKQAVLR